MDYFYTTFRRAHTDGTPVLYPMWFNYPSDPNTFPIDLQLFFGPSILVSPVTEENSTSVEFYLPKDIFYDFLTYEPVQGHGSLVWMHNVNFTSIPVHIKGGVVLPLRAESTMTTAELRKTDFEFVVAPGSDGTATGSLYIDDGLSIADTEVASVEMSYSKNTLSVKGTFKQSTGVNVADVKFLNVSKSPSSVKLNGSSVSRHNFSYDAQSKVLSVTLGFAFDKSFTVSFS